MVQLTAVSSATAATTQMSKSATVGFRRQQRPDLRNIAPGQLWLVEVSPEASELPSFEHRVFVSANVVIYDRVLSPLVAAALPLGNYAEPATARSHAAEKSTVDRCLRFALDGWSVIRLVKGDLTGSARSDRLLRITEQLLADGISPNLPVQLLTTTGNTTCEEIETCLGNLDAVLDARNCEGRVTAVFSVGSVGAAPLNAVAANGLAG
jgi:siroheme synthase